MSLVNSFLGKIVWYATSPLRLILFVFAMVHLAIILFSRSAKMRIGKIDEVIVVHVHPELMNAETVSQTKAIAEKIESIYQTLYGVKPIVLIMPIGMTIHSIDMQGFCQLLNKDQLRLIKNAIQKIPNNKIITEV
jgi:hypothetical protein